MVILFAGTDSREPWRPRGVPARLLTRPTSCAPCRTLQCRYPTQQVDRLTSSPAVSVIVPPRRHALWIRRRLESLRAQTFTAWECLGGGLALGLAALALWKRET